MKKVLMAVIFCLLVSNMAKAECAWVLWTKTETLLKESLLPIEWVKIS